MNCSLGKVAAAAAMAFAFTGAALADNAPASAPTSKIVYHVNEGVDKAVPALRNVANHLTPSPARRSSS